MKIRGSFTKKVSGAQPRRLDSLQSRRKTRSGERVAELRELGRDLTAEERYRCYRNDRDESDQDSVFGEGGSLFILYESAGFIK